MTAQPDGTEPVRYGLLSGAAWRKAWAQSHPEDERHGDLSFYNYWHCRCDRCRATKAARRLQEPAVVVELFHTPDPYTVAEHRALHEPLCPACTSWLETFRG